MKCLRKDKWVKMPREIMIGDKGIMNYYMKLVTKLLLQQITMQMNPHRRKQRT